MAVKYYLGFDGGQSGSRALLSDSRGHVVARVIGPPFEHFHAYKGAEKIKEALRTCLSGAIAGYQPITSAFFGLSGVWDSDSPEAQDIMSIVQSIISVEQVIIDNDSVSCWAGAFGCKPGIALAAGTGVVAYGVGPDDQSVKIGGWGYLMGDQGGAYDIGRKALIAVANQADRGNEHIMLAHEVLNHFEVGTLRELQSRLYQLDRGMISGLAPIVAECAKTDDAIAAQILCESGEALAETTMDAIHRLRWNPDEPITIAPVGGVFKAGACISDVYQATIVNHFSNVRFVKPRFEPMVGSLLLAWRQAGIELSPSLLEILEAQLWDRELCSPR